MRRYCLHAVMALLLMAGGSADAADPPAAAPRLEVHGATFRVTLPDGRTLPPEALVGAEIDTVGEDGAPITIRIERLVRDPIPRNTDIMLHEFSVRDAATGTWSPLCEPDIDGHRAGLPIPTDRADPTRFMIACTAGVQAKCVRFGYRPWANAPDGTPLAAHFEACTRLFRADYCGDGRSWTRVGEHIGVFDRVGVLTPRPVPNMTFEAAWGPRGAVCVRRTRVPANGGLDALAAACPERLPAERLGETCDPEAEGALLINLTE